MALPTDLKARITALEARANDEMTKLTTTKANFSTTMDACISKVGKSQLEQDPAFRRYNAKNGGSKTVADWLATLSIAEKIEILVDYSIDDELNGNNVYEKDLKDAQEVKESTKLAIKQAVKQIKADFKKLMEEHKADIEALEALIKQKEEERERYALELAKLNSQTKNKDGKIVIDNTESANIIKEQINRIDEELKNDPGYRTKLQGLIDSTKEYENRINSDIEKMEQSFREQGIEINEEVEAEMKNSDGNNSQQSNDNNGSQMQNSQDDSDMYSGKPVDVARRMMGDFKNLSPEGQEYVIKYGAYEDLLNMTKSLNLWDQFTFKKRNIRNAMLNRMDDLGGKIVLNFDSKGKMIDDDGNYIKIINKKEIQYVDSKGKPVATPVKSKNIKKKREVSIDELLSIGKKDKKASTDVLDLIVQQLNYYQVEYDNMTVPERRKANETMQMLKMAIVVLESKRGGIRRFFSNMSQRGTRLTELGQSLTDFANYAGERDSAAHSKSQKLRSMLKVKINPRKSKVRSGLDASKRNIFQRKTNRRQGQDEMSL